MEMGQNNVHNLTLNIMFASLISLFYYAPFFGVFALSADRFLAIHLHQELVTHKRVVAVVPLSLVVECFAHVDWAVDPTFCRQRFFFIY